MQDETVIRRERTELYVGLFIVAGLAMLGAMIWQFSSITDRFRPSYDLTITLPDATGVIINAPVRLAGVNVGKVKSRAFTENFRGIQIGLEIYDEFRIPEKSEFSSSTSGLMGDNYIKVVPPDRPTGKYIAKGATIDGGGADLISDLTSRATALSDQMAMVLGELDSAVRETRVVVENLTSVSEKFDRKVMSEGNVGNFDATMEKLSETTDNLAVASEKLAPLIDESKNTVKTAAEPFEEAKEMIAKLDESIEKINPAFEELEPTIKDLRETINKANEAIDQITKGDGLIAAIIADEELKGDVKSLIANLEKHGVLGYKKGRERDDASETKKASVGAKTDTSSGGASNSGASRWGMFRKR